MSLLTTQQAADKLGLSRRRVIAMITDGKLPAQKLGRDYFIREEDLKSVTVYGKSGRPPKAESSTSSKKSAIVKKSK